MSVMKSLRKRHVTVRRLVILKPISLSVRAVHAKSRHSCVRLCVTPGTVDCQALLSTFTPNQKLQVHGIGGSSGLVLNWALWTEYKETTMLAFSLPSRLPLFIPLSFLFFFLFKIPFIWEVTWEKSKRTGCKAESLEIFHELSVPSWVASVSLLSFTEDLVSYTDADVDLKKIQTEVYRYKYRLSYRYGSEYRYWEKIEIWKDVDVEIDTDLLEIICCW